METRDPGDEKLDALLGRLKEPVPATELEGAWRAIDSRLKWRKPMNPLSFVYSGRRPKLVAAMAAAAMLLLAFIVGVAQAPVRRPTVGGLLGGAQEKDVTTMPGLSREDSQFTDWEGYGSADDDDDDGDEDTGLRFTLPESKGPGGRGPSRKESTMSIPTGTGWAAKKQATRGWAAPGKGSFPGGTQTEGKKRDIYKVAEKATRAGEFQQAKALFANVLEDKSEGMASSNYKQAARELARARVDYATKGREAVSVYRSRAKKKKGGRSRPMAKPPAKRPSAPPDFETRGAPRDGTPYGVAKGVGKDPKGGPRRPARAPQKIIKTAVLEMEVRKFSESGRKLDELVARHRGFYADSKVTQNSDGTTGGYYVIRVPQAAFESLYAELKKLGRVKVENAKGEDVTAQFTDLDARIRNLGHIEKRLLALLVEKKRRGKMSEILEVERELGKRREEIEKLQGSMRVMVDRISYGTIHLTLAEPARIVPAADFSIEVKDAAAADKSIIPLMAGLGGQVASRQSVKRNDGTTQVSLTLKVPMPKFGGLVDGIKALGRADRENVQGYNPAAIARDPGAKDVMSSVRLALTEPGRQKPGGVANIEVKSLQDASVAVGALLKRLDGALVSRQEQRTGPTATATYKVRVARARFAELAAALSAIGRIENKQMVGVDVLDVEGPAAKVPCDLTLTIYERTRQVPSGAVSVATVDLDKAADAVRKLLASVDGQILTHTENRIPGGVSRAEYTLRCRRARFAALVGSLDGVGRIEQKNIRGLSHETLTGDAGQVLCTLSLIVFERRAPVPRATLQIMVDDPDEASAALKKLRDSARAKTTRVDRRREEDGDTQEIWELLVPVADFESFVSGVEKIGEVKFRRVQGIGAGLIEQPDPKALAQVNIALHKPRQVSAPPPNTFRGTLSAAFGTLWWVVRVLIFGLIVIVPMVVVIALVIKLLVRLFRRRPVEVPVAATAGAESEKTLKDE